MKNLSIFAMLIVLFVASCKEKANIIPQTTPPPATPSPSPSLTSTYTQKMDKQWLLGRHLFSVYPLKDTNGMRYANDTVDMYMTDTTLTITVTNDTVITFMGQTYHYTDTTTSHWLESAKADTGKYLLFYWDKLSTHSIAYVRYYYIQDSVMMYTKSGSSGFGISSYTYFSK